MTLAEARNDYIMWEKLATLFPANHAIQAARLRAYEQWLRTVRYWRLNNG